MAISFAINCCIPPAAMMKGYDKPVAVSREAPIHKVARAVDFLVAITAVVVGVLGIVGVIGMPPAAAFAITAAGGTCVTLSLFSVLVGLRIKCMSKMAELKAADHYED